jgi:DNA-binding protein H-NS
MSEALKTLNNIRTLRAQAREIDLATLSEILEKLTSVVEDRRQEDEAASAEIAERQAKLEKYRQQLIEDGIDPTELLGTVGVRGPMM